MSANISSLAVKRQILSQKYVNKADIMTLFECKSTTACKIKKLVMDKYPNSVCAWDMKYLEIDSVLKAKGVNKEQFVSDLDAQMECALRINSILNLLKKEDNKNDYKISC